MHKRLVKASLSKLNFVLRRNPKINKRQDWRKFIPEPYKAVITITADFELAWAWRYSKLLRNNKTEVLKLANKERDNIPYILHLCEEYNVPVTWATVGHLFLKKCKRDNGIAHKEIPPVKKYKGIYWDFNGDDWFEDDPCTNHKDSPEWYAPDLIENILNSKVNHEIGCHTFSHIDCRDEVCPHDLFEKEINACKSEAGKLGLELKSFVHPGHQTGKLDKLSELGFTSFQTDSGNILSYPVKHSNDLWELRRTCEFSYRKEWSVAYHIYRFKKIIDRAISSNTVCNFWFHPSFSEKLLHHVLPEIFKYINSLSQDILISTVWDYITWLNNEDR